MVDGRLMELTVENERTESALNIVNEKLESQGVSHNGVHIIHSEEIHRILVRLSDVDTKQQDTKDVKVGEDESINELLAAKVEEDN